MTDQKVYCGTCTHYRHYKFGEFTGAKITGCIHKSNVNTIVSWPSISPKEWSYCVEPVYMKNKGNNCEHYEEFKGLLKMPHFIN